jgi:hypothetical protein
VILKNKEFHYMNAVNFKRNPGEIRIFIEVQYCTIITACKSYYLALFISCTDWVSRLRKMSTHRPNWSAGCGESPYLISWLQFH